MKSRLLLPTQYRITGLIILLPSLVLGILYRFYDYTIDFLTLKQGYKLDLGDKSLNLDEQINLTDELALTGLIIGLIFIAFSKRKQEDEFIHHVRLESWQWSVLISYGMLLIAIWLVHGLSFIDVMMYNMLTPLIVFIIRFYFVLSRSKGSHS